MSLRTVSALAPLLLLPLAGACASSSSGPFDARRSAALREPLPVEVRNNNYADVDIHLMNGGQSLRLGMVTGNSSATLRIEPRLLGSGLGVRLLVDPIGSTEAYLSDEVSVVPGSTILLTVGPQLSLSSISLR